MKCNCTIKWTRVTFGRWASWEQRRYPIAVKKMEHRAVASSNTPSGGAKHWLHREQLGPPDLGQLAWVPVAWGAWQLGFWRGGHCKRWVCEPQCRPCFLICAPLPKMFRGSVLHDLPYCWMWTNRQKAIVEQFNKGPSRTFTDNFIFVKLIE